MNIARLLYLADFIEKSPELFDMTVFANGRGAPFEKRAFIVGDLKSLPCDSVCCMAGAAVGLWGDRRKKKAYIEDEAARVLGLQSEEAEELFLGCWSPKSMEEITAADAAARLRELAEGGQ